ncbi:peptidase S9 [Longispora fulva]|uniref:Pimeloyl-ACP methyl ester carboxylesterase n=1 Tax=Longispora fulva TaxID=619741 RepID=A0A8J7GUG7_9ACTN|nr:prolyl oligopeptidase family serine peptidase [Longispora fulva]MBG6138343.1 pimeloyl-ACP methyl ester carboxylesterase [Longispora fulva]GIG60595.1 peptidase S9 [Longispora fulva]
MSHTLLRNLLDVARVSLLDIDDTGRILISCDTAGSADLHMLTDGALARVTDLPDACTGRFGPDGDLIVQHDTDGDGHTRLRRAPLAGGLPGDAPQTLLPPDGGVTLLCDTGPGWIAYTTNRANGVDFDLYLRDTRTGRETLLHHGGLIAQAAVRAHPDQPLKNHTALITVWSDRQFGTELHIRTPGHSHLLPAPPGTMQTHPHVTPAGQLICASNANADHAEIIALDAAGHHRTLVSAPGHDLYPVVPKAGGHLLSVRNTHGFDQLTLHDPDGQAIRTFEFGEEGVHTVRCSPSGRHIAVHVNSPGSPAEIHHIDTTTLAVTGVYSARAAHTLPPPRANGLRVEHATSIDGEQVPCLLYPPDTQAGPARTVLMLHGGPQSQDFPVFSPLRSALTAAGFLVVSPNVRGSTGYGKRWYGLDDRARRADAIADLEAIWAHLPSWGGRPDAVVLVGGSYGGYMTLAGLAFQPGLWAGGVDLMGPSRLDDYLAGTAAYRRAVVEAEYGRLDTDLDLLRALSPGHHTERITRPVLIIHGRHDPKIPLAESENLHAQLTSQGVPSELVVYPDEGHGLAHRHNRLDAYTRILDFIGRCTQ